MSSALVVSALVLSVNCKRRSDDFKTALGQPRRRQILMSKVNSRTVRVNIFPGMAVDP